MTTLSKMFVFSPKYHVKQRKIIQTRLKMEKQSQKEEPDFPWSTFSQITITSAFTAEPGRNGKNK